MMKLKDLKVGTQLRIGMSIILTFVAILGALAWFQADRLWQETKGIYDHPLQVRRALDKIAIDILSMHRDMKDLVMAENEQERQSIIKDIDVHEADAARQFDILYDRFLGPRSEIDQARNAFVQWKSIRTETLRLLQAGKIAEATGRTKSSGVGGGHVEKLMNEIKDISDFATKRGDQFYADAQKGKDALIMQMGTVLGAIFLMTLGVGYLLLKNIKKPLKELTIAAEQFRGGRLDARSGYASANEFGSLAAAFNALAETIQTELQSKESAARIAEVMLEQEDMQAFCRALIKDLLTETGSQIGAIYVLNEQKTAFEHFESIGLAPSGRASFSATSFEGEFGAALATGKIQRITEIPADARFTLASVGGDFQPREIITIPISADGEIAAVISLANIRSYPAPAVRLVKETWYVLTARWNGVLSFKKIRALAEQLEYQNQELQAQAEEMTAQSIELRTQAEELRKQKEELQEQNVELAQQRLMVEEASRMKSQFLSNMSHELRTPLNSVMALSRVLMMQARTKLNDEEVNYVEIIERNGKKLLALINDLLDLSKIEAGRMDVNPKTFSLRLTLENILESIGPLAGEKHIEIHRHIPDDLTPLESDEIRVSQILQNLLANAVKFTDAGTVTVSVESYEDNVSVRIADTGIGIEENYLPYIFDEFRQVDGTSARRYEGTGLGLAIALKAARMLGGDIAVQSTPGKGSTFTLTLPIAWQGTAAVYEPIIGMQSPSVKSVRKTILVADNEPEMAAPPRILMVEDNEAAIIQVIAVLEAAGYVADVAKGGQEAMDYVSHTIPDGIILDLMMPGIDGFEVLEKIRSTQATANIPVLVLTAKDLTPGDFKRLSANNIQQLVQKGDVDRENLLLKIGAMLGTRSG